MAVKFRHNPETILFAIDLDPEIGKEALRGASRLSVLIHTINFFVQAKKQLCSSHRYGLLTLTDQVELQPGSITSSPEILLSQLGVLQPSQISYSRFDMAELATAVAPISASEQQLGHKVRVVLLYSRSSTLPSCSQLPQHQPMSLPVDLLFLHEKPDPQLNRAQEVYSTLEQLVDVAAVGAGHQAFIYEANGTNLKKMVKIMAMIISHPLQRRSQTKTPLPVDMAAAPLQPLPSELASAAATPRSSPLPTSPVLAPYPWPGQQAAAAAAAGPVPMYHVPRAVASAMDYSGAAGRGSGAGYGANYGEGHPMAGVASVSPDAWSSMGVAQLGSQQQDIGGLGPSASNREAAHPPGHGASYTVGGGVSGGGCWQAAGAQAAISAAAQADAAVVAAAAARAAGEAEARRAAESSRLWEEEVGTDVTTGYAALGRGTFSPSSQGGRSSSR